MTAPTTPTTSTPAATPTTKADAAKTLWAFVDAANADVAAKALALDAARKAWLAARDAHKFAYENAKRLAEAAQGVDDVVKAEAGGTA